MKKEMRSKLLELAVALGTGTIAADLIWMAGAPELAWLGFATVGIGMSTESIRCRARHGPGAPQK